MFEAPPPQAASFAIPSNQMLLSGRGKENEDKNNSPFSSPSSLHSAATKDSAIDVSVPADPSSKNAVVGLETAAVEVSSPLPATTAASVSYNSTAVSPAGSSQQQQGPLATKRVGKKAKKCIHGRMAAFCVPCEGSQVRIDAAFVLFM